MQTTVERGTEALFEYPMLIQGGLGVGISDYKLARAMALAGEKLNLPVLGTVSATGVEVLMARRLQDGDPGGYMRIALAAFPNQEISERILQKYFFAEKPEKLRYIPTPKLRDIISPNPKKRQELIELSVVANFAEVYLAKHRGIDSEQAEAWLEERRKSGLKESEEILEKHTMPIAANGLEDIQALHGPRLYGQMLAGVDFVIEGAGNPHQVPNILDLLAENKTVIYKVDLSGSKDKLEIKFDPEDILPEGYSPRLTRPKFLAIVSFNVLAEYLLKKVQGVDGLIVEGKDAGGHSANPRGEMKLDEDGEPVFGKKDEIDLSKIISLGIPTWFAGAWGSPEKLVEALETYGAAGAQTGTQWVFSEESGLSSELKGLARKLAFLGRLRVRTHPYLSPTGYLFKVADLEGTLSDPGVQRKRKCDLGHLIDFGIDRNGKLVTSCVAGPGGKKGYVCLCNALLATAGYPQADRFDEEPAIVTLGKDLSVFPRIMEDENDEYTVEQVVKHMFRDITPVILAKHRRQWGKDKSAV